MDNSLACVECFYMHHVCVICRLGGPYSENCDRCLENAGRTDPKPVNNLFIFFQALKRIKTHGKKNHASVTVTVEIRTALRTNQIVGFTVTVPACNKDKYGLLTKCEVKMAGHWPSSFFACLWTKT